MPVSVGSAAVSETHEFHRGSDLQTAQRLAGTIFVGGTPTSLFSSFVFSSLPFLVFKI